MSIRAIATALNRSPSTISREVQRNRGVQPEPSGQNLTN
ncbi:helix-turn-helix domain protein [Escherichia coli 99.0816]|nr:helix-turn-helix domain protein [Escherichia coli 99.0816]